MGLDAVELVMEVEEAFDITIADADAEQIRTAGDLFHYVLLKLPGDRIGLSRCPSAAAFYRLRRALMDHHGLDRRAVRPDARMAELIPPADVPGAWARLGRDLGWRLPSLGRPRWLVRTLLIGIVSAQVGLTLYTWGRLADWDTDALGAVALWVAITTPLLLGLAYRATRPLAVHLPAACATVRGTIRLVVPGARAYGREVGLVPANVWFMLRRIIAEISGVDPETITEESNFLTDLGFG